MHLFTTGGVYPASHPLLSTIFSETLASPEATVARALELATDIAENTSTMATAIMRDLLWRSPNGAEETHLLNSRLIFDMFGNDDNMEGVMSFFAKCKPDFKASFNNREDIPAAWPWWTPVSFEKWPRRSHL